MFFCNLKTNVAGSRVMWAQATGMYNWPFELLIYLRVVGRNGRSFGMCIGVTVLVNISLLFNWVSWLSICVFWTLKHVALIFSHLKSWTHYTCLVSKRCICVWKMRLWNEQEFQVCLGMATGRGWVLHWHPYPIPSRPCSILLDLVIPSGFKYLTGNPFMYFTYLIVKRNMII